MWGRGLSLEIVHEGSRRFAGIWGGTGAGDSTMGKGIWRIGV